MDFRIPRHLLWLLPAICAHPMTAQMVGIPIWSSMECQTSPYLSTPPLCGEGSAYALGNVPYRPKNKDVEGRLFPVAGKPLKKNLSIPYSKDHTHFNTFFIFRNAPHVLYDQWDKETGRITLFVQRYSPETFDVAGGAVEVGTIPLDPKSYSGSRIKVEAMVSPDGTHVLFYFDDIVMGGVKLVMCWVMDEQLDPVWKGAYKVPVQAHLSQLDPFFTDGGRVYLHVNATVLDEKNTKEKDGETVLGNVDHHGWKRSKTYYELHGETFRMWDGSLPDGGGLRDASIRYANGRVLVAGIVETDKGKDGPREWFIGHMDEDFKPVQVARGRVRGQDLAPARDAELVTTPSGSGYLLMTLGGMLHVLHFDAELGTVWERTEPWGLGLADFYWWNGRLLKAFLGRESDVKALTEGKKAGAGGHSVMPILVWWDESGKRSVEPLLPADVKRSRDDRDHHWPDFSSLGRYGAYVDWSHDKSRRGVVRVDLR